MHFRPTIIFFVRTIFWLLTLKTIRYFFWVFPWVNQSYFLEFLDLKFEIKSCQVIYRILNSTKKRNFAKKKQLFLFLHKTPEVLLLHRLFGKIFFNFLKNWKSYFLISKEFCFKSKNSKHYRFYFPWMLNNFEFSFGGIIMLL